MDFKNRHPLNAIDGYESLSMLEALIPFVDYPLKLPLALFLKYSETRLIIKCFRSNNNLISLGLHNPCNDPLEMIGSFTGISPDILKMMFSMMENGNHSPFSNLFNTTPDTAPGNSGDNNTSDINLGFSMADISNAMNLFHSMQSGIHNQQTFNATLHPQNETTSDDTDDFERNIQQLLAEYDMAQAEQYDHDKELYNHTHNSDNYHASRN